jgi:hypothetical protein
VGKDSAFGLVAEFVVEFHVFLLAEEGVLDAVVVPANPIQQLDYALPQTLAPHGLTSHDVLDLAHLPLRAVANQQGPESHNPIFLLVETHDVDMFLGRSVHASQVRFEVLVLGGGG